MNTIVILSSLAAILLAVALAREVRLRRALQRLLTRIFSVWGNTNAKESKRNSDDVEPVTRERM
jgi:hypothetical protein